MHKKIKIYSSSDKRGKFLKIVDNKNQNFKQIFISKSKKNVFRGFHYYSKKNKSNRIIFLLKGEIEDYLIDLRKKNFGKVYKINIKENSNFCYLLPWYCAHAFFVKKESLLLYLFEKTHKKKYDLGINYKDIINLKIKNKKLISKRDLLFKKLSDINV